MGTAPSFSEKTTSIPGLAGFDYHQPWMRTNRTALLYRYILFYTKDKNAVLWRRSVMDLQEKQGCLITLKAKFDSYSRISAESWACIQEQARLQVVKKGEVLLRASQISRRLFFICKGALRAYCTDAAGNSYNKNLFLENDFAGSTVSAILKSPSTFTLECLEDSILISIDYRNYRELIFSRSDLKDFYIAYLERNWVIEKEQREVSIVQENATTRYLRFLEQHPDADRRIALQHIASHLGITPTQLSRIRKSIKK